MKFRHTVCQELSLCAEVKTSIEAQDEHWGFANNKDNLGMLTGCADTLRKSFTPLHRRFLCEDAKMFRKSIPDAILKTELIGFLRTQKKVEELSEARKLIVARYHAGLPKLIPVKKQ